MCGSLVATRSRILAPQKKGVAGSLDLRTKCADHRVAPSANPMVQPDDPHIWLRSPFQEIQDFAFCVLKTINQGTAQRHIASQRIGPEPSQAFALDSLHEDGKLRC